METNPREHKFRPGILGTAAMLSILLVTAAFADNPVPSIVGPVKPQAVAPGSGAFILTVYGANFVPGAVVNWNDALRSTTFISARELRAQILASDVAFPTAGNITVTNPAPGGGNSSSSYGLVEVHTPTATIIPKRPHIYAGGFSVVAADFNNDGELDFAGGHLMHEIALWLGNGNGTFGHRSLATHRAMLGAMAFGDFNGDGNRDLVFAADPGGPPFQFQVRLGNGDGTFRAGSRFGSFYLNKQIVVGDFNGDGKLDLAVTADDTLVFLGRGDGTFLRRQKYRFGADAIAVGDFNGDGKLDLVVNGPNLFLLVGNGDGTFQKPRTIGPSAFDCGFKPGSQVNDFNGDGNLDVAFCISTKSGGAKIGILLGRGDGTFEKPVFYPVSSDNYYSVGADDFNSDGKTDLVVSRNHNNEFALLLGNGDGTFQHETIIKLAEGYFAPFGILAADFDSDGLLDFVLDDSDSVVYTQK